MEFTNILLYYFNGFISYLDTIAAEPSVKFLLIAVTALIVIISIGIVLGAIKRLFTAIFCRKKKPRPNPPKHHLPENKSDSNKTTPIEEKEERKDDFNEHLQEAQALIPVLNNSKNNYSDFLTDVYIPQLFSLDSLSSEIPLPDDVSREANEEDTKKILSQLTGKGIFELNQMLKTTQSNLKASEIILHSAQEKYSILSEKRTALLNNIRTLSDEYNRKASDHLHVIEVKQQEKEEKIKKLTEDESILKELVTYIIDTSAVLEQKKELLVQLVPQVQQEVNDYDNFLNLDKATMAKSSEMLKSRNQSVRECISAFDTNNKEIVDIVASISDTNRSLATNQLTARVIGGEIKRLTAEKEEAEAREKALAEARRKEEERIAAEKAEEQRKLEEMKREEERKDDAKTGAVSTTLSEDDEIAQTKAIIEAQRERRRKEAVLKGYDVPGVSEPSEHSAPSEALETSELHSPSLEERKLNVPGTKSDEPDTPSSVDIMAQLKEEWAKEKEARERFEAEKVARAAEIARRKAEIEAGTLDFNSSSTNNNTN